MYTGGLWKSYRTQGELLGSERQIIRFTILSGRNLVLFSSSPSLCFCGNESVLRREPEEEKMMVEDGVNFDVELMGKTTVNQFLNQEQERC